MTEPATADLPDRLEAVLTERFTELGNPFAEMRRHEQGPDGWPASHPVGPRAVAEVLRELLASSAGVVQLPPANQAALRDRIAAAIYNAHGPEIDHWDIADAHSKAVCRTEADAVLKVLPSCSDPIECSYEAALGQAEERLRQVLGVAEVIEANGIGWAADSVRRAAKGELS